MTDYGKKLEEFISRAEAIKAKLALASKSEFVSDDVKNLTEDMMHSLEGCDNEMYYPAVYNGVATIRTAPEKCSVAQLSEALSDAAEEMKLMLEYID